MSLNPQIPTESHADEVTQKDNDALEVSQSYLEHTSELITSGKKVLWTNNSRNSPAECVVVDIEGSTGKATLATVEDGKQTSITTTTFTDLERINNPVKPPKLWANILYACGQQEYSRAVMQYLADRTAITFFEIDALASKIRMDRPRIQTRLLETGNTLTGMNALVEVMTIMESQAKQLK